MGVRSVLEVINKELESLGINYFYLLNNSEKIVYPYVTGEYYESGYRFEDNCVFGSFILEAWTRGELSELFEIIGKIKGKFCYFYKVIKEQGREMGVTISYVSSAPRDTQVEGLKKIQINLDINYWESD